MEGETCVQRHVVWLLSLQYMAEILAIEGRVGLRTRNEAPNLQLTKFQSPPGYAEALVSATPLHCHLVEGHHEQSWPANREFAEE